MRGRSSKATRDAELDLIPGNFSQLGNGVLIQRQSCAQHLLQLRSAQSFVPAKIQIAIENANYFTRFNCASYTFTHGHQRATRAPDTTTMISTFITSVSAKFNPFARAQRMPRIFLSMLPPNARSSGMKISVAQLPRESAEAGSLNLTFSMCTRCKGHSLQLLTC